jgi:hypothetical protein
VTVAAWLGFSNIAVSTVVAWKLLEQDYVRSSAKWLPLMAYHYAIGLPPVSTGS